jgi:hypothetical protein
VRSSARGVTACQSRPSGQKLASTPIASTGNVQFAIVQIPSEVSLILKRRRRVLDACLHEVWLADYTRVGLECLDALVVGKNVGLGEVTRLMKFSTRRRSYPMPASESSVIVPSAEEDSPKP